jgi:putative copper export protein
MVKIKNAKAMKTLKVIHLLTSSVWAGGIVCVAGLAWICFSNLNETAFAAAAPIIPKLYPTVIAPAAFITVAQGAIYGLFTNWRFLKYKWIIIKWILTALLFIAMRLTATGMASVIKTVNTGNFADRFTDGRIVFILIAAQIVIMAAIIIISVFKPFKKKQMEEKK